MNNDIILFDIDKIREEKEKFIQRELEKLKDSKMTDYEKRLKILLIQILQISLNIFKYLQVSSSIIKYHQILHKIF